MADNTIANAIKFLKGEEKSLPATKTEGQVYFAYKDVGTAEKPSYTGAIYIDTPIGGTQTRIKMTANADIADKAFNDSAGLNIRNTYLSSLGYTDDGKQTILIKGSGNNQTRIALPIASLIKSGIVTTDAQSFGGTKTFITINSTNLTVTGSSSFSYTGIETATGDKARPVWFAYNGINGKPVVNTNFTYNPATQTLSVANLSGTADKATKLATARTITLSGAVTGSVSFDGSTNVTLTTSVNHTHSQYYDSNVSRTKNTVLAAPNGADGKAVFRSLVAADIPTLTKSKISDFPTSLKNPNALTITLNGGATEGTNKFTYDGSVAKTINITPSGIGAATSGHTHNYAGSSSAGGSANSAIKLATARKISLKGLSQGSANFDGSGDITIEDTGYGCKKYVTQNAITEPYFRIAYFSTKNIYVDASMIFVIDSGFKGGGYGIVKVAFRSDNCVDKDKSSCEVLWLVRQGFEANQLFVKGYAPAGGTQYVDLYFKATGTYQAVTIRVLSSGGRGSQNRNWTFEESAPLAAATIRAYSYTTEGFDAGTANLSHFATKLQTARTISLTGSVTGSGTFDGSGNLSITTSTNHSHSQYLPLSGGNMTGNITYGAKGTCYIGSGANDAANMVGGALNNLVIASWNGISFTTPCSSTFIYKSAVSIDCRNGVLAAASLRVGNGSGSTINFCTNGGTAAPGAKIVAYNDRIEFVFA